MTQDMKVELYPYMGGILRQLNAKALQIGGTKDHVHLLLEIPHTVSVSDLVRVLKTNSCRWIHQKWKTHGSFAWQEGYGAFSVSESRVSAVTAYIAGQEEHHKAVSFQKEFLEFLRSNGIEYDERYIWK